MGREGHPNVVKLANWLKVASIVLKLGRRCWHLALIVGSPLLVGGRCSA